LLGGAKVCREASWRGDELGIRAMVENEL
jgi:hypothetical protein